MKWNGVTTETTKSHLKLEFMFNMQQNAMVGFSLFFLSPV